jgi:hypothetical protein
MKILMLSTQSSLHLLLQQVLLGHDSQAQVWRTHTLASALPYLRQEPEIETVMLDVTLCGWSRLVTLVTTLRPCLGGRKLALLIDQAADESVVRSLGVTVDACVAKADGVTRMVNRLVRINAPAPLDANFRPSNWPDRFPMHHTALKPRAFTQLAW